MPMKLLGDNSLMSVLSREYGDAFFTYILRYNTLSENPKRLLFDLGSVRIDTPLTYLGTGFGESPVRVSVAFKESPDFEPKAERFAKKIRETRHNLSLQVGGAKCEYNDFSLHPPYTWDFPNDLDVLGTMPELGVLYTFYVIEEKIENIVSDVEFLKLIAKEITPQGSKQFQSTLECIEPPRPGSIGRIYMAAKARA